MKNLTKIFLLLLFISVSANSQDLKLEKVLPPYLLDAVLLNNGHFFVNTSYLDPDDDPKSLIYNEDGGGITPPNFTSHIHIMIDSIVFQMPYEDSPINEVPPPENPLQVNRLFRDTVAGVPRINSELIAEMPDGEKVEFIFSMEPSKRPSGGFIKMSVASDTSGSAHQVGILMLVDTKIGVNDRAPIVTSIGYFDTEQQFTEGVGPGVPEFWLALEGNTVQPELTARGNLKEQGLLPPDFFMFGNWADYTGNNTIKGLGKFIWKDRNADNTLPYTDSAVLMIWDEETVGAGQKKLLGSTEIGLVDSLEVVDAGAITGGGGGGGAGSGIFYARPNGCVPFDTLHQTNCNDPDYHPYYLDTLDVLFIITNTKDKEFTDVRIEVESLPTGLYTAETQNSINPNLLQENTSAVGIVSFYADPRLYDTDLRIPITLMGNNNDTLAIDELCVFVPGILGEAEIQDMEFGFVCPSTPDTMSASVLLEEVRCREVRNIYLEGNAPDINYFNIAQAIPTEIAPNQPTPIDIEFNPGALGNYQVNMIVEVIDFDGFPGGDTLIVRDTAVISGIGKDEEFFLADIQDTLDLGAICIGDTASFEWAILNRGGCDVSIIDYKFVNDALNQYDLANAGDFPLVVPKEDDGDIGRALIQFIPNTQGQHTSLLIVESPSAPLFDTLVVTARADLPRFDIEDDLVDYDTICPGSSIPYRLRLENPTACVVDIDTVIINSTETAFSASPLKFSISSEGSASTVIQANFPNEGTYTGSVVVRTVDGFEQEVPINVVVASRELQTELLKDFGDVRVGVTEIINATVTSTGSAEAVINNIRIRGVHAGDYNVVLPAGVNYPIHLQPTEDLTFDIEFTPTDIENRDAFLDYQMTSGGVCAEPENTDLAGRGIRPVINLKDNSIYLGDVCVGETLDTVATVRNFGNGILEVNSIDQFGNGNITLDAVTPFNIDPEGSEQLDISFTPDAIGDFEKKIYFNSNGDWLTTPDTLLVRGRGIVCAEISVGEVNGIVGTNQLIPVRITPDENSTITSQQIAQLMNDAGLTEIEFTITHNPRILRFNDTPVNQGYISGIENKNIFPESVTVTADGNLTQDNLLAMLEAEILLGDDYQSELNLEVNSFANGYSRITVKDGVLIADFCSFDKRLLEFAEEPIIFGLRPNPISNTGYFELYLKEKRDINIYIIDNLGNRLKTISKSLSKGEHLVPFEASEIPSGSYQLILQSKEVSYSTRIVIVK